VGSSSTSTLQSRLAPEGYHVFEPIKKAQKPPLRHSRRCTGINHTVSSPTATSLLQMWHRWPCETVGCLFKQSWGICWITWSSCCVVCTVHLFIKEPLKYFTYLYISTFFIIILYSRSSRKTLSNSAPFDLSDFNVNTANTLFLSHFLSSFPFINFCKVFISQNWSLWLAYLLTC